MCIAGYNFFFKLPFVSLRTEEPEAILIIFWKSIWGKSLLPFKIWKENLPPHLLELTVRGEEPPQCVPPWKWSGLPQGILGAPVGRCWDRNESWQDNNWLGCPWLWMELSKLNLSVSGPGNSSSELWAVSSLCMEPEPVTAYIHFPNSVTILSKHSGEILLEEFFGLCGTHGLCQMTQLCYCGMLIYHRMDVAAPKYCLFKVIVSSLDGLLTPS